MNYVTITVLSLGIKGDTGDPGNRGPRGLIGKVATKLVEFIQWYI